MAGFIGKPNFKAAYIGNMGTGNYLEINENGNIRAYGDAIQWDVMKVPITSTKAGGSKDPGFTVAFNSGSSQGVFTWFFDPDVEEELYFPVQLPHNWEEGTNIEAPCTLVS